MKKASLTFLMMSFGGPSPNEAILATKSLSISLAVMGLLVGR